MPELHFTIRWPDGAAETCYSPSTIIRDHFVPGTRYPMPAFLDLSRIALTAASDRVRAIYGAPCSLALGQLARIEVTAARYATSTEVIFESFREKMP
jgi:uncharacterized repeat protein (TIGR04042 family)